MKEDFNAQLPIRWVPGRMERSDKPNERLARAPESGDQSVDFITGTTKQLSPVDGWWVTAEFRAGSRGIAVNALRIEPLPKVREPDGYRDRTDAERAMMAIDTDLMNLVTPNKLRQAYRDVQSKLANMAWDGHSRKAHYQSTSSAPAAVPKRKPTVMTQENLMLFAADVIEECGAPGFRSRLADRWHVSEETVKYRIRELKVRGFIVGRGSAIAAGPTKIRLEERRNQSQSEEQGDS